MTQLSQEEIKEERLDLLRSTIPYAVLTTILIAGALLLYFTASIQHQSYIVYWSIALVAIESMRVLVFFILKKQAENFNAAVTIHSVLNFFTGSAWGLSMLYLLQSNANPIIPAMIVGILTAAYILLFSSHYAVLLSALIPLLMLFFYAMIKLGANLEMVIAGIVLTTSLAMIGFTRRVQSKLEKALHQEHEQNSMLHALETEKLDTEEFNQQLQTEISQREQYQQEAEKQKRRAEAANMAKDEFLATMSHEIRTPLNGIVPILELLQGTNLDPEQEDYLNTAIGSSSHLLRIIDDILDYSKIQAGKLELETVGLNLREVVHSVIELMQPNARSKNLQLSYEIDPNIRLSMRGDPVRLRQILGNLVSNAIKFTEKGGIRIKVSLKNSSRSQQDLLFQVKDTGIGMNVSVQEKLFKPFAQADASTSRLHGGTGLGLVICKRLVDLMSGKIGVKSQMNRGSIFWFTVSLLKSKGDVGSGRTRVYGCKTLFIAPAPDQETWLIKQQLSATGLIITQADTLQEAIDVLQQSVSGESAQSIELIIFDARQSPHEAEVLNQTLNQSRDLSSLPCLTIQSPMDNTPFPAGDEGNIIHTPINAEKLQEQISLALGIAPNNELETTTAKPIQRFSEFRSSSDADQVESRSLQKPSDIQTDSYMAKAPHQLRDITPVNLPASNAQKTNQQARALLVEDNQVNAKVAMRLLEKSGLQVDIAINGAEALKMIETKPYDLVFMDCQMPIMDGYEATGQIRINEQRSGQHIPIIAMTANAMAGDRQKCMDAGMDDYLSKPIKRDLLEEAIQRWLKKAEKQEQTAQTIKAAIETHEPVAHSLSASPTQPEIDNSVIDDLIDVMGEEFIELIEVYLRDTPANIKSLIQAASKNDIEAIIAPAHSLKSASANVGALQLSELAKEMELGGRKGKLAHPLELATQLAKHYDRAAKELKKLIQN